MSFRVNTNVAAMNALRNLGMTNGDFSKSITRLSTGLRINSAADDPSGLIISEKFRAQISGMGQAIKNSQDAINYAKTAEGAFDEVNRLLKDARALAVASANTGALTPQQIQANQEQLTSIANSITRIAKTTQYGTKKLLDGTSGTQSSVTAGSTIAALRIGGTINGDALTDNATVTLDSVTAATKATVNSSTFASATAVVANTGSFTLNGVTFTAGAATTANDLITQINASQSQTGVVARYDSTGSQIVFESTKYGENSRIDLVDANGVVLASPGTQSDTGSNAEASITIGSVSGILFTGGLNGNDGLTLTDGDGNTFRLTEGGNVTTASAAAVGQVVIGSSTFQIGSDAGQTVSFALGNYVASELGTGVVTGLSLADLNLDNMTGATDAIRVIDKAIDEISRVRGQLGNFQRNVLESNIRSLGVAKENLSATESSIRDIDVAEEMTNYTKLQILQQSGLSVLAQANSAPQQVLNLLRG